MIINPEDLTYPALEEAKSRQGGTVFLYNNLYWQAVQNNDEVFFVSLDPQTEKDSTGQPAISGPVTYRGYYSPIYTPPEDITP